MLQPCERVLHRLRDAGRKASFQRRLDGGEALYERGPQHLYEMIGALGDSPPAKVSSVPRDRVFKMILLFDDDEQAQAIRPQLAALGAIGLERRLRRIQQEQGLLP